MTKKMFPKQVRLTQQQNQKLKRLAKERGVSESEVMRQVLKRYFEELEDPRYPHPVEISVRIPGVDQGIVAIAPDFDAPL